MNSRTTNSSYF